LFQYPAEAASPMKNAEQSDSGIHSVWPVISPQIK